MSRYKDVELYRKILREEIRDIENFENSMYRKGKRNGLILAKAIMLDDERIPTADVTDVKHGEWIYVDGDVGYNVYRCSKCGGVVVLDEEVIYNYCPNCGAKMEDTRHDL